MKKGTLTAGLILLFMALPLAANEMVIPLEGGKPTPREFDIAAKRALSSRKYELWATSENLVIGRYRGQVEMSLILGENSVVIRNTDTGGRGADTINKYLRNLERDLSYELAGFTMAPAGSIDPDKAAALVASVNSTGQVQAAVPGSDFVIAGRYQSRVTSSNHYVFTKASQRSPILTFTQKGNEITGVAQGLNLKVSGTIEGDEIRFYTWPSDITSYELKGTWKISEDGRRLTGKWRQAHGGGDWNLTRID